MATVAHWLMHVGCTEGSVRRSMAWLLAAAGAAMSALVGLVHGDLAGIMAAGAAGAAGLAAYLAIPASKKHFGGCSLVTTGSASAWRHGSPSCSGRETAPSKALSGGEDPLVTGDGRTGIGPADRFLRVTWRSGAERSKTVTLSNIQFRFLGHSPMGANVRCVGFY